MISKPSRLILTGAIASILAACGGGGGGSGGSPAMSTPQSGSVSLLLSDASTEDWATIGVKVLSIALVPQGGGNHVSVYSAPAGLPVVNLVELDQLGELIGNASIPAGTYTGAVLTISGNPGDVLLNVAADPEAGFAGTPGAAIPSADIQIQHTQGATANLTVPVSVKFASPLVVNANQNNQLDIEFDLGHPALIVGHVPPAAAGATIWAVDFDGPVRHHPLKDITRLVLRHMYGEVSGVSSAALTITKEYPTEPAANPETPVATSLSLQIQPDAVNGTLVYDVDQKTVTRVTDFTTDASLASGKQVRVAARYQPDGSLVATRVWVSSSFSKIWLSPEGHVLHVNNSTDIVTIQNEDGTGIPVVVDANTQFFFRTPQNALADATPIATGTAFLASDDLVRGFKVHASVVDPLASPLVAQTIDIETATYDGTISAPTATSFTYTRKFRTATDDYQYTLDYISATTANGNDPASGDAIQGYQWWYFAYPTVVDSGTTAISDFATATNGAVNFGGLVGAMPAKGISYTVWNDLANPNAWFANASIITPSTLPLGAVANGLVSNAFTMTVIGGATAATVNVSTASGGATLVYQVDRTNGIVTVSSIDVTTSAGLATLTSGLAAGTPAKVYGVPKVDGTLKAYVLTYFTGTTLPGS